MSDRHPAAAGGETPEQRADRLVAAFILRDFREDTCPDPCPHGDKHTWAEHDAEAHLANCPRTSVTRTDSDESLTSTGTAVSRLTATLVCDHGVTLEHEYGEYGSLPGTLARIIEAEERARWLEGERG